MTVEVNSWLLGMFLGVILLYYFILVPQKPIYYQEIKH